VLLMSVNPGFGGQNFLPLVYNKIQKLREFTKIQNPSLEIEIDGGVNGENAKSLVKMGADILVAGSFVFGNSDYKKQIQKLNVQ
ncbi:MAG: ribulose-phosphate 3-epimerase, partial [Candidatus Cloacimonetes bacterium]|nr:ribulose-phosphate 3-epimerase [Candidatus Cloacimonadota bacterium]